MQITVFGASGRVGSLVVELLLQHGHSVVAFVHSHNPLAEHNDLRVMVGDVSDHTAVSNALQNSDAAISCVGSWGTPTKDILTEAMEAIIPIMQDTGPKRIISLTGNAAFMPDERVSKVDTANRALLASLQPKILADRETHAKLLLNSKLDWTIIRAPVMLKQDTDIYRLDSQLPPPWAVISYKAVATAMVDQLTDTKFIHAAPGIHQT